jgi:hypothetical protein
MEILKFDNAATPRRKKSNGNLKSLAGLATVAAIAVLGSTLAANISLGTSSGIEFGQGVQSTAACDSAIDVTPSVRFINGSGSAATFYLSTIALSSIDFRSATYCTGKTFTLSAYDDTTATPLQLATGTSSAQITQATFSVAASGVATGTPGVTFSTSNTSSNQYGSVTLGFGTPTSTSGAVYKITLQSQ